MAPSPSNARAPFAERLPSSSATTVESVVVSTFLADVRTRAVDHARRAEEAKTIVAALEDQLGANVARRSVAAEATGLSDRHGRLLLICHGWDHVHATSAARILDQSMGGEPEGEVRGEDQRSDLWRVARQH